MPEHSIFMPLLELKRASSRRICVTLADSITAGALILCVAGWSLLWAQALSVVDLVPQWLSVALFFVGIGLIPACRMRAETQGEPRS
jgi:hypothetical protein